MELIQTVQQFGWALLCMCMDGWPFQNWKVPYPLTLLPSMAAGSVSSCGSSRGSSRRSSVDLSSDGSHVEYQGSGHKKWVPLFTKEYIHCWNCRCELRTYTSLFPYWQHWRASSHKKRKKRPWGSPTVSTSTPADRRPTKSSGHNGNSINLLHLLSR